jgi:ADP-ribose pyrophosphatase YjhB (NUDIX family)
MNPFLRLAYWAYQWKGRLLRPITVGVRILLVEHEEVVLVRHTYQPGWQFPGGGMKWGETLAQAAAREAREEVGARLLAEPSLFGVYTNLAEGKSDHIALFLSENFVLETPTDRWEIAEYRRFPIAAPPSDLHSGYKRRLREYVANNPPYTGVW